MDFGSWLGGFKAVESLPINFLSIILLPFLISTRSLSVVGIVVVGVAMLLIRGSELVDRSKKKTLRSSLVMLGC